MTQRAARTSRLLVLPPAVLLLVLALCLIHPGRAAAAALQIRPLMYRETLAKDAAKRGFVDVSNAGSVAVTVEMDVRGFRQTDDQGHLRFYRSAPISRGVALDLREFELGPREAVRVYFQIDPAELPQGDVFAAIFAATKSQQAEGIVPSAQVGTLLIIQNGKPGARVARVQSLDVAPLQLGTAVRGTVQLRNPAPATQSSGYFPKVTLSLTPFGAARREVQGPLVMSGVSRRVEFDLRASRIGFYRLTAASDGSSVRRWVFMITGYWRAVVIAGVLAAPMLLYLWRRIRRRRLRAADLRPQPVPAEEPPAAADVPVDSAVTAATPELPSAPVLDAVVDDELAESKLETSTEPTPEPTPGPAPEPPRDAEPELAAAESDSKPVSARTETSVGASAEAPDTSDAPDKSHAPTKPAKAKRAPSKPSVRPSQAARTRTKSTKKSAKKPAARQVRTAASKSAAKPKSKKINVSGD